MDWISQRWPTLFVLCAAAYIGTEALRPFPWQWLVKVLPILMLLAAAFQLLQDRLRTQVILALCCSAAGDVLLTLPGSFGFLWGLGAFLCAQACYAWIFFNRRHAAHSMTKMLLSALAGVYAVAMAFQILPDALALRIAVLCYLCVITLMLLAAVWAWNTHHRHLIGAALFVASDSLLAWNMFVVPLPWASPGVMSTYYLAQYLLLTGIIAYPRADS